MTEKQFFDYCRELHKKTGGPNDKLIAAYQHYMGVNASLRVSNDSYQKFMETIENPPEPTKELVRLMNPTKENDPGFIAREGNGG